MTFRAIRARRPTPAGGQVRRYGRVRAHGRRCHDPRDAFDCQLKDGLTLSGKSPVIRRFPMVLGVDLAGIVRVRAVLTCAGRRGRAHRLRTERDPFRRLCRAGAVNGDWLVKLPTGLTRAQAMAIGTAGFTPCWR